MEKLTPTKSTESMYVHDKVLYVEGEEYKYKGKKMWNGTAHGWGKMLFTGEGEREREREEREKGKEKKRKEKKRKEKRRKGAFTPMHPKVDLVCFAGFGGRGFDVAMRFFKALCLLDELQYVFDELLVTHEGRSYFVVGADTVGMRGIA
jgi:hypothetical protein